MYVCVVIFLFGLFHFRIYIRRLVIELVIINQELCMKVSGFEGRCFVKYISLSQWSVTRHTLRKSTTFTLIAWNCKIYDGVSGACVCSIFTSEVGQVLLIYWINTDHFLLVAFCSLDFYLDFCTLEFIYEGFNEVR